jgi:hypothetical protein
MTKNIYVPPIKKNSFALLSNEEPIESEPEPKPVPEPKPAPKPAPVPAPTSTPTPTPTPKDVDFKVYYKNTGQYQKREGVVPYYKREGAILNPKRENLGPTFKKEEEGEGEWQYQKHNENKRYEQLKYIYLEVPNNLGELKMNNYYRLLAHHNADSNWNFNSYHHVTTLKTWEDVSKLFNTLNLTNYKSNISNFDFFIMRNEISPLWEDEENRCGSICSVKIDTLKDGYNILKTIFINICNNTLMNISKNNVPNWNIINGVSFSCKKIENVSSTVEQDYSMIKIWFKTNYTQFDNIDKYFNDDINALLKKYSIKVRAIKPEY